MFVAGFGPSYPCDAEKQKKETGNAGKSEETPNEKEENAGPDSQIYFINGQRLTHDEYLKLHPEPSTDNINLEQKISALADSISDHPNASLNNVSRSVTEKSLIMGVPTAVGCAAAFVPVPVLQEVGIAVCAFGSIATAGTALTGNILESKEPKK